MSTFGGTAHASATSNRFAAALADVFEARVHHLAAVATMKSNNWWLRSRFAHLPSAFRMCDIARLESDWAD